MFTFSARIGLNQVHSQKKKNGSNIVRPLRRTLKGSTKNQKSSKIKYRTKKKFHKCDLDHFCFNEEPFLLFKFPWTISEGSIKNSFFEPLEKVLEN